MPEALPLSVVVITKNEAGRLAGCLDSVRWTREVIVVDDESTDDTLAVARRYTPRVFQKRMEVEGRHRNWAYAQAAHEWVLSLDADERVTPELGLEIQSLLRGSPESDVYSIPRRNYIGTQWIRHGGWYPSPQVKLFRRSVFQWEDTTVHPRALTTSKKPWGTLKGDLIHYSYRDLADFVSKLNRQTTLEAQKWVLDGRRMTLWKALWRTADRFVRTLIFKKGYRDGFIGFFVSLCGGGYQFLSFAKYWRLKDPSEDPGVEKWSPPTLPHVPAKRLRLSAVILTRNAAATISRCLASVQWMDEIIVVDGESTDQTLSLCTRAGATVIRRPVTTNFGEERNVGTARATGDWILQLDADEVVTPQFRETLEEILRGQSPYAAYRFRRTNFFLGHRMRWGGWEHQSLHLFRRGRARYEGRVHERLLVDGPIGSLAVGVYHYPFRSVEEFLDRQNRYTTLEARELLEGSADDLTRHLRYQLIVRPAKLFWKLYIKKGGFLEGFYGFLFSALYSFVHHLKWAKVREALCASS